MCITARERQTCCSSRSGNWRDPAHWRLNAGPQQSAEFLGGALMAHPLDVDDVVLNSIPRGRTLCLERWGFRPIS